MIKLEGALYPWRFRALLDCPASQLTGPGTGLDAAGVSHKARVIDRAAFPAESAHLWPWLPS